MSDAEGAVDANAESAGDADAGDAPGATGETSVDPSTIGEADAPPVEEKPFKVVFEANKCFGAGKCAEVSPNWEMDVATGVARPETYFFDESELDHNVAAAENCPAKKGDGVIHVVDRRTDEEIAPDPHGDGTLSVDW